MTDFGIPAPNFTRLQRSQGSGATARLITHFRCSAELKDKDCTFMTAQSPEGVDFRQVGAVPLKPWLRAQVPSISFSATFSAS
ncbi:hypothetical protein NicSoilB4_15980 [Arthrobacter sp. NicSoilB4]|nr:hypothetical protein NicSoilB4_15980 [Arthrobacter sp. NicSoilB4]